MANKISIKSKIFLRMAEQICYELKDEIVDPREPSRNEKKGVVIPISILREVNEVLESIESK